MNDGEETSNQLLELHILPTLLVALIVPCLFFFCLPKIREWKRLDEERKRIDEERKRLELLVHRPSSVDDGDNVVEISAIYIYPVKSLRAVSVQRAMVDSLGLEGDRRLMLVRPSTSATNTGITHRFVTQRQCAALATINVSWNQCTVTLSAILDGETKSIELEITPHVLESYPLNHRYKAGLWNDVVEVVDIGDTAAEFIQNVLEKKSPKEELVHGPSTFSDVRVVAMLPNKERRKQLQPPKGRKTDKRYVPPVAMVEDGTTPETALTDGFPILVTSEESLAELNRRLDLKGKKRGEDGSGLPMSRFRPNIVVKGLKKPFDEDTWKAIQIRDPKYNDWGVILHIVKGCPRCKQSCTDQQTGERDEEPLETLRDFRALGKSGEDVYFGQNAVIQSTRSGKSFNGLDMISVGDKVKILTRGDPVWDLDPVAAE